MPMPAKRIQALLPVPSSSPENSQGDQQQHLDADQELPLTAQQVRVDDREQHEGADAQEDGEDLHDDLLVGVHLPAGRHHAGGGPIDHHRAEDGADHANDQQEHIRPLPELLDIGPKLLYGKHSLSREMTIRQNFGLKRTVFYHSFALYATACSVVY